MQMKLVKYGRFDFFFRNHLKFSKFLELNVLTLESKIPFYSDLNFLFSNCELSHLRITIKLEKFTNNLIFFFSSDKEKKAEFRWFNWLIKIIQKKLKIYHQLLLYKINNFNQPIKNLLEKKKCENNFSCVKNKFLNYLQNNKIIFSKVFSTFFNCIICGKLLRTVHSFKSFESANQVNDFLFSLKLGIISSISNFFSCKICGKTSKIIKKVLLTSNNQFVLENFIFLIRKFEKNILTENIYPILQKNSQYKFDFLDGFFEVKKYFFVFKCFYNLLLICYSRKFPKFLNKLLEIKFSNVEKKNLKIYPIFFPILMGFRFKIQKYKKIEQIFLKSFHETLCDEVYF